MKITPIGIYGPYPAAFGASGCYLVEGETRIVLDLGCGAFSRLRGFADPSLVDAFVLTHLHYDHFCDVLPLSYYPGKHVVYCPGTPADRFSLIKNSAALDVRVIGEGVGIHIGNTELSFTRTAHGVETYAVRVSENGRSFVYTSDTAWFDGLVGFCRGSELILSDCCPTDGTPHMAVADVARLQKETGVRTVAVHLDPEGGNKEKLRAAGIEYVKEDEPIILW